MYKKSGLAVILFMLVMITGYSQFQKGMRMAGVNVASGFFNSGKSDYSYPAPTTGFTSNNTSYGITVNPMMGWFVSDNTAVGALLNLNYNHQKSFDEATGTTFQRDITNTFNIGIGGFARNYFTSSGTLKPFGQFNLNLGIGSSSDNGFKYVSSTNPIYKDTYDGKSSGGLYVNSGLSFGATKMINAHTGLDFFVGYTYSYSKNTFKTTTQTDFGNNGSIDQTSVSEPTQKFTNNGVSIGVGFQIFLDQRK